MNTDRIIEKLNAACNILDSLRAEIINETKAPKGKKKTEKVKDTINEITKELSDMGELNRELTIKQVLEKYDQPTDDEHIANINRIVEKTGITLKELDSCIERVKTANDKEPKNDIYKYTYSCLYKIKQGVNCERERPKTARHPYY